MLPHAIRYYDKLGDEAFLYATWLKSYRNSVRGCPTPIFNIGCRMRINKLLARPTTNVVVACHPDTPEMVFGYMVCEGNALHYLYVKSQYRKQGIARALLDMFNKDMPIQYTHKANEIWIERKLKNEPKYIYNPCILEQ
jgi:GNAT superfamily N-acetyltransferase